MRHDKIILFHFDKTDKNPVKTYSWTSYKKVDKFPQPPYAAISNLLIIRKNFAVNPELFFLTFCHFLYPKNTIYSNFFTTFFYEFRIQKNWKSKHYEDC